MHTTSVHPQAGPETDLEPETPKQLLPTSHNHRHGVQFQPRSHTCRTTSNRKYRKPKKRHLTTIPAHLRTEAATSHIPLTSFQRYSRERGNTKLVIGLFLTMSRLLDQQPIARRFQAADEHSKSNVPKSRENQNLALTQSKYLQFVHRAPTTNGTVQNLLRALMDLMFALTLKSTQN